MTTDQQLRERSQEIFTDILKFIEQDKIREWVDLFTADGVLEFAFPPPGAASRFVGHDELYNHMKHFPELLDVQFSNLVFHETTDPELIVAEFSGDGKAVPTGNSFHQDYIAVVRTANGKITHFRDFWNPLVILEALGGADAVAAIDTMGDA